MSDEQYRHESLNVLREIRDTQREILAQLAAQRTLAEQQVARSRDKVEESIGLQRLALQRQRTITLIAVPGILVCIVAIGYLVLRYF
ncbi:hypothetical protein SAMN05216201_1126 [Pseudomonas linyingensis]|uniref:Uncharacterized protein n=1 Tax=Pseudomonas linyingensis TaxID=915471 RepID=A0A1H7A497_9PSED|nr:hypothetical protein [Pseudomonas linyingensis]SEJ60483.1 hypothetical protein SAMN05216201_1126 [Pseudomonas linyingensis]